MIIYICMVLIAIAMLVLGELMADHVSKSPSPFFDDNVALTLAYLAVFALIPPLCYVVFIDYCIYWNRLRIKNNAEFK